MATYRLTFEERKTTFTPDPKSDTPKHFTNHEYVPIAAAEADDKVMAGTLRALADKLDPPKTGVYRD